MLIIDRFYSYLLNSFLPKDEFDPDKVYCSIDDKVVSCDTWDEEIDDDLSASSTVSTSVPKTGNTAHPQTN